jgi:hypothetical protein
MNEAAGLDVGEAGEANEDVLEAYQAGDCGWIVTHSRFTFEDGSSVANRVVNVVVRDPVTAGDVAKDEHPRLGQGSGMKLASALALNVRRGRREPTPLLAGAAELRDREPVALSDDLAARDLGLVGHQRLELLVVDPGADELARLLALLAGLEETE